MLSKKNRVGTKEVDRIFKEGRSLSSPNLLFKYIRTEDADWRISFLSPKSGAKKAVARNLLRRRGYSALEKCAAPVPPGVVGVFVFKKYQDDALTLQNEIKAILAKIH